jgi:phage-related protein
MLKPLKFVGSSKKDLSAFPDEAKQEMGHSLYLAQQGGRALNAKILQGFGSGGVVELVEDHDGNTYRCVYTTKMKDVIVVLHAFQKKSKRGIETPRHEVDLIHARFREAQAGNWN